MIEQIIEKFEKKYRASVLDAYPEYNESHNILLNDMQNFIRLEFSSYNKQLLDGIEGEIKELPTESVYDHEGDYYYGTTRKKDVLLTVNKYRV